MIWFACKQCGKKHGRGENLIGTLVFCDCGAGNSVPWVSTIPEPAAPPPEAGPAQPRPRRPALDPLPARPSRPLEAAPAEERPAPPPPPRRPREIRRPKPQFCFQHDEAASTATCEDCKLRFCATCVVTLGEHTLCGPCKNFRLRGRTRPPRTAPLAVLALVVALVSGPVTLMMTLLAVSRHFEARSALLSVMLCLLGLVLPVLGTVLGWRALRQIETQPQMGGQALALSGSAIALAGVVWSASVAVLIVTRHALI